MMREQKMASLAHSAVAARAGTADEARYRTLCMKTPTLLLQAGLVQGVAFLRSRKSGGGADPIARAYLSDLSKVATLGQQDDSGNELYRRARGETDPSLQTYLALSEDVQRASEWLRRLAQAELTGAPEELG